MPDPPQILGVKDVAQSSREGVFDVDAPAIRANSDINIQTYRSVLIKYGSVGNLVSPPQQRDIWLEKET